LLVPPKDLPPCEVYPLSLHDALPICPSKLVAVPGSGTTIAVFDMVALLHELDGSCSRALPANQPLGLALDGHEVALDALRIDHGDRKSTRLNSSHVKISYAVFCLKKK